MSPENQEQRLRRLEDDLRSVDKANAERYHSLRAGIEAVGLLTDHQRRNESVLNEHDDRLNDLERLCGNSKDRLDGQHERIRDLEAMNIAVLAAQVQNLREQVTDLRGQNRWIIGSLVSVTGAILTGIIVFLVTQGPG